MADRSLYEEGNKVLTPNAFEFVLDSELKRAVRSQNFLTLVVVEASREWEGMTVTADDGTLQEVAQMRVGHIVATLKAVHRQHLMVAEDGGRRIRGLFSASQVARQLGMELQTFEVAQSFADIEAALVR